MLNFSEFLKWHISRGPLLQIDFIRDFNQETILVDRIGRFENLNQDIIKIKESIGLNCSKTELKHKNPSIIRKDKSYKEMYSDSDKSLVMEYFKTDLEYFDYNF